MASKTKKGSTTQSQQESVLEKKLPVSKSGLSDRNPNNGFIELPDGLNGNGQAANYRRDAGLTISQIQYRPVVSTDRLNKSLPASQLADRIVHAEASSVLRRFDFTDKLEQYRALQVNPFYTINPALEYLIQQQGEPTLITAEKSFRRLQSQMSGITPVSGVYNAVEPVKLDGQYPLAELLRLWSYGCATQMATLPLGRLGGIVNANAEKFITYAGMILNRYLLMGDLPYGKREAYSKAMSDAATDLGDGLMIPDELLKSINQFEGQIPENVLRSLTSLTGAAKVRYISTQLLQPLFRDVLIDRGELTSVTPHDILTLARTFASWKRNAGNKILKESLTTEILQETSANSWIREMTKLQQLTSHGVPVPTSLAMAMLQRTLAEYGGGRSEPREVDEVTASDVFQSFQAGTPLWATTLQDDEESYEELGLSCPVGTIGRYVETRNVHGDIIGVHDTFESYLDDVDANVIQGAIILLARLTGVRLENELSLQFMTYNPEWSGLVNNIDESEAAAAAHKHLFGAVSQQFMTYVLRGEYVDNPLLALFDEPNRQDLQRTLMEDLNIYAIGHKAYVTVLREFLGCVRASYEYQSSPVWRELDAVGVVVTPFSESQVALQPDHWREMTHAGSLVTLDRHEIKSTRYFLERGCSRDVSFPASILRMLDETGSLGVRQTHLRYRRRWTSSAYPVVDALSVLNGDDAELIDRKNILAGAKLTRLSDISPMDPIFDRPMNLNVIGSELASKNQPSDDDGLFDDKHAIVMLTNVAPYLTVEFTKNQYELCAPRKVIGNALTDSKSDGGMGLDPSQPIIIDGRALYYDGIRLYDVVDPSFYMSIESDSQYFAGAPSMMVLPHTFNELRSMTRRFAYNMLVNEVSEPTQAVADGVDDDDDA